MIVDVGWRGGTQTALSALTGVPWEDIFGCYINALRPGQGPDDAHGYLLTFGAPKPMQDLVLDGYALFELFFSAPHATVTHYLHDGARWAVAYAAEAAPERRAPPWRRSLPACWRNSTRWTPRWTAPGPTRSTLARPWPTYTPC